MSKKPKTVRIKIASPDDFSIPLSNRDGQAVTFRAGQIAAVVAVGQGCKVWLKGSNVFHEINEPADVVNSLVDHAHRQAAIGFYDAAVADAPVHDNAKPNRKERRAAKSKKGS